MFSERVWRTGSLTPANSSVKSLKSERHFSKRRPKGR
jgi:hypothetical protein